MCVLASGATGGATDADEAGDLVAEVVSGGVDAEAIGGADEQGVDLDDVLDGVLRLELEVHDGVAELGVAVDDLGAVEEVIDGRGGGGLESQFGAVAAGVEDGAGFAFCVEEDEPALHGSTDAGEQVRVGGRVVGGDDGEAVFKAIPGDGGEGIDGVAELFHGQVVALHGVEGHVDFGAAELAAHLGLLAHDVGEDVFFHVFLLLVAEDAGDEPAEGLDDDEEVEE